MLKKRVSLLLSIMMLSLSACGGEGGTAPSESSVASKEATSVQESSEATKEVKQENSVEELGPLLKQITFTDTGESVDVYLNFPIDYSKGRESLYYHMTFDTENTEIIALVGYLSDYAYGTLAPELGITSYTIENVLPAHTSMLTDSIDYNYGGSYSDFAMEIADGELVDVNGTEMCKHTGKLTYTLDGTSVEKAVVGYAAPTSIDSYVFFVVCGPDEAVIAEDAEYIAKTIRETKEME